MKYYNTITFDDVLFKISFMNLKMLMVMIPGSNDESIDEQENEPDTIYHATADELRNAIENV